MRSAIENALYFPRLKWKAGERLGISALSPRQKSAIVPIFNMPSAGDFCNEEGRVLSPTEHIRSFGPKLRQILGRQPAFVDALEVSDRKHSEHFFDHPLTELLERGRLAQASVYPATALDRPDEYQFAIRRFLVKNPKSPVAVMVRSSDLDRASMAQELSSVLDQIGTSTRSCLILLDFSEQGPLKSEEVPAFVDLLIERLNEFPKIYDWLNVVVSMTSFPQTMKLKSGDTKRYFRSDWQTYRQLKLQSDKLFRVPRFGDYGVEACKFGKVGRAIPSAHLRYTTRDAYILVKGNQAKAPVGMAEIFPVAARLLSSSDFFGADFSPGDATIARLGRREGGPGSASTWRGACTNHHLVLQLSELGFALRKELVTELQKDLFSAF